MIERYTISEVAQLLECEPETIAERIKHGDLPGVKFGRSWVIPGQALDQRLNELALEECRKRRQEKESGLQAGLMIAQAKKAPRRARIPPALPDLL